MNEQKMKALMIDYIDGQLTGELATFVEKHINKSAANRQEFESLKATFELLEHDKELAPDASLKSEFLDMLDREMEQASDHIDQTETKVIGLNFSNFWQLAAAVALLAVGALGGIWLANNNSNQQQILTLQKEMESTKQLVMMALDNKNSASERMMGVNASFNISNEDDEITNALIKTMNEDENINVRLAAINALTKFADEKKVRQALVSSLEKQQDPLVQITLINLMVDLKEKGAIEELQHIIQDSTAIESVKDEAHMAVFKLS